MAKKSKKRLNFKLILAGLAFIVLAIGISDYVRDWINSFSGDPLLKFGVTIVTPLVILIVLGFSARKSLMRIIPTPKR